MRGTQKRDKKNYVIVRAQKFNPGQIKYVRTLAVFFSFLPPLARGVWWSAPPDCAALGRAQRATGWHRCCTPPKAKAKAKAAPDAGRRTQQQVPVTGYA
jgi:hypothetical protein